MAAIASAEVSTGGCVTGAINKRWRVENAEYLKQYKKINRRRDLEQERSNRKRHAHVNRLKCSRRRARRFNAPGYHTSEQWQAVLDRYGYKCLRCGSTENLTEDHVLPLSKGGSNWIENIQPLCGSCNSSKQDTYADYRPEKDRVALEALIELGKLANTTQPSRVRRGTENGRAKLTNAAVIEIKENKALSTRELANKFGVSVSVINNIKAGRAWRHLKADH